MASIGLPSRWQRHSLQGALNRNEEPWQGLRTNSKDDILTVKNWLREAGIGLQRIKLSQGLNWLYVNTTILEAERLMRTEYYMFEHTLTRTVQVACHEYHLPAHISKLVDFVTPTVHFDAKIKHSQPHNRVQK
jgi:tripeptidyl-peptidase-1